jgi:hypothetical protein
MLQKYFGERAGHGQYTNQTAQGARKGINLNILPGIQIRQPYPAQGLARDIWWRRRPAAILQYFQIGKSPARCWRHADLAFHRTAS